MLSRVSPARRRPAARRPRPRRSRRRSPRVGNPGLERPRSPPSRTAGQAPQRARHRVQSPFRANGIRCNNYAKSFGLNLSCFRGSSARHRHPCGRPAIPMLRAVTEVTHLSGRCNTLANSFAARAFGIGRGNSEAGIAPPNPGRATASVRGADFVWLLPNSFAPPQPGFARANATGSARDTSTPTRCRRYSAEA